MCRFGALPRACRFAGVLRRCGVAVVACACRFAGVLRTCRVAAVACSLAAVLCACAPSVPALECAIDVDCGANAFCAAGQCLQGTRTCPLLEPKLSSINQGLFQVSCGTGGTKGINCHARDGAATASGLDLSTDPYTNLVNRAAVTTFLPASAPPGLVLVKAGDGSAGASFLVEKLQLPTASDPALGAGMPADAPGSICADAITVVQHWIAQGAQRN